MIGLAILVFSGWSIAQCGSFTPAPPFRSSVSLTILGMGKGLNRARNKQAALAKKMAIAKKAALEKAGNLSEEQQEQKRKLTAQEIKDRNDHLRFEDLLKRSSATVLNDYADDGYLTKEQEEEEIRAVRSGVDRIFEGDPAPTEPFEELVGVKSENAIGSQGAARLVPWLRKNPNRQQDYLVILCDPRMKSPELRQAVSSIRSDLPADIQSRLIIINADSPAENRRWIKKNNVEFEVYSDEKMEWMRAYTALGQTSWSMTMFIVAKERVQKLSRNLDLYAASRVIQNAVKSLDLDVTL